MLILKQSVSVDIRLGPFVAVGDGFTPISAAQTLTNWDQAEVLKFDGAATVSMAGAIGAVASCAGWYDYTVAVGDVDTVGEIVFVCQDASVFLPVFVRAMVVEEAVYDAYYLAAATGIPANAATTTNITAATGVTLTAGTGLGNQTANITGTIDTVTTVNGLAAGVITANSIAQNAVDEIADGVWDEVLVGHVDADSAGLVMNDWQDAGRLDAILDTIASGTPQTGDAYLILTEAGTEPVQATPVHTSSLAVKIATIFKFMVNKKTATATEISVYNSVTETTVDHKSTISEAAGVYTEGEYITGP
jgi:hypothetical protein